MFISFKTEQDAIRQAYEDCDHIKSLGLSKTEARYNNSSLVINSCTDIITDTYKLYLDTLIKLVGAYEWKLVENNGVKSVVLIWNQAQKLAA